MVEFVVALSAQGEDVFFYAQTALAPGYVMSLRETRAVAPYTQTAVPVVNGSFDGLWYRKSL